MKRKRSEPDDGDIAWGCITLMVVAIVLIMLLMADCKRGVDYDTPLSDTPGELVES